MHDADPALVTRRARDKKRTSSETSWLKDKLLYSFILYDATASSAQAKSFWIYTLVCASSDASAHESFHVLRFLLFHASNSLCYSALGCYTLEPCLVILLFHTSSYFHYGKHCTTAPEPPSQERLLQTPSRTVWRCINLSPD